jgi:hypothetical protein
MPYTRSAPAPAPRFQPGARVQFRLANRMVRGKIVEYRGPLAGGRPLYRVEVPFSANYVQFYELPEGELEPAQRGG